jgi:hypothetical protein
MTENPFAALREAVIQEFRLTPADADLVVSDPELRRISAEILEGRRSFAEAMARLDRTLLRLREAAARAAA